MMSFNLFAKTMVVVALGSGLAVACAPKKKTKTPITKADGSAAKGAPSAETIEEVLKKVLADTYKIDDEKSKRVAQRLSGATLKVIGDVVLDKKAEVAAAKIELKVLFSRPVEAAVGTGEIRSENQLGKLEITDMCGRKTEDFEIEARCTGKTCDWILAMARVTSEGGGEAALLFHRTDSKKQHSLVWSSSGGGEVKVTGPTDSLEGALKNIIDAQRAGEHYDWNEKNMTCPSEGPQRETAPVTQVPAQPAAPGQVKAAQPEEAPAPAALAPQAPQVPAEQTQPASPAAAAPAPGTATGAPGASGNDSQPASAKPESGSKSPSVP